MFRLHSLDKSRDELPYSLVMVANEQGRSSPAVIGYCRLVRVISMPSSVLIESGKKENYIDNENAVHC